MDTQNQDKQKLVEQYDAFAEKFKELYLTGKDRGKEAMTHAMEKTREDLTALGEFSVERGETMKAYLARDLEQTVASARTYGETLSDEAKKKLQPSRLKAGALASLAFVLEHTNEALHTLMDKTTEAMTYKTGEITSAGSLTCQGCAYKMQLKKTGHIPPCPKCSSTLFHKGY